MKRNILFIIAISITIVCNAQHAIGSWQSYLSYHNVNRSEPAGNLIYALGNGSLFSYDNEDNSIHCYQKNNPLNDTEISYIAYENISKTLVIIYSNANIDLLVNDEDIYNIPEYMNKVMSQNKNINNISFTKEYAYLSTAFGVIVLNLKKKEISNSYILNKNILACVADDSYIYTSSSEGLFVGKLTDNLLDINNWKKVSNNYYSQLVIYNDNLIGNISESGIYLINKQDYTNTQLSSGYYSFINKYNNKLIGGNNNSLILFDNINKYHYLEHNFNIIHLSFSNGTYWGSNSELGLLGLKYNETTNTMENTVSPITPNSPIRNCSYYMTFSNENLLITGGGMTSNRLSRTGTAMSFSNNNWNNFQDKEVQEQTGLEYKDITSIAEDPNDSKHHFVSSAGEGIYEFINGKFIKQYTLGNSPLESALAVPNHPNYVRVDGLKYDNKNNLWMANSEVKDAIKILKVDGKWVSLHYPEIAGINHLQHIVFDRRGWAWINSLSGTYGLFCLNTNNTLEDSSDDKHKFITNFINQDGSKLDIEEIHCIIEDKEGAIWIGTKKGPLVLNNPSNFFNDNIYFTQIKVPRNDGTNLADFLLSSDIINAIAIDGANRKWIGTDANGIYLLSADGLETIHHFTAENSPLLSNSIQSIAIHSRTGEVFIGTSKGLISYQSDATEAGETFSENVYAYPNPVKPDYTGVITVTGLVRDTDVKITNINGKLIYSGTSVGGQFTWNGKNQQGARVPSGIYFVLAADSEGKEGVATKILFIK